MKRLLYLTAIIMAAVACNNGKEEEPQIPLSEQIIGEWELMDIETTKGAMLGEEKVEVTIIFNQDMTFTIEQMLGYGRPVTYKGTWTLPEDVLSGTYSDGKKWASDYKVVMEEDTMYMTPNLETAIETCTYKRVK